MMGNLSQLDFDRWCLEIYKRKDMLDLASLIWFWSCLDGTQDNVHELKIKHDLIVELMGPEIWFTHIDIYQYRREMMVFTPFSDEVYYEYSNAPNTDYYEDGGESLGDPVVTPNYGYCNTTEFVGHPILGIADIAQCYLSLNEFVNRCDGRIRLPFRIGEHSVLVASDIEKLKKQDGVANNDDHYDEIGSLTQQDILLLKKVDQHDERYVFYRCRFIRIKYSQLIKLSHKDIKNKSDKYNKIAGDYTENLQSKIEGAAYLTLIAKKNKWSLQEFEKYLIDVFIYFWFSEETEDLYSMNIGDKDKLKIKKNRKKIWNRTSAGCCANSDCNRR